MEIDGSLIGGRGVSCDVADACGALTANSSGKLSIPLVRHISEVLAKLSYVVSFYLYR